MFKLFLQALKKIIVIWFTIAFRIIHFLFIYIYTQMLNECICVNSKCVLLTFIQKKSEDNMFGSPKSLKGTRNKKKKSWNFWYYNIATFPQNIINIISEIQKSIFQLENVSQVQTLLKENNHKVYIYIIL